MLSRVGWGGWGSNCAREKRKGKEEEEIKERRGKREKIGEWYHRRVDIMLLLNSHFNII